MTIFRKKTIAASTLLLLVGLTACGSNDVSVVETIPGVVDETHFHNIEIYPGGETRMRTSAAVDKRVSSSVKDVKTYYDEKSSLTCAESEVGDSAFCHSPDDPDRTVLIVEDGAQTQILMMDLGANR